MRILSHRTTKQVQVKLRRGKKDLPAGSYVKIVDTYYVPKDILYELRQFQESSGEVLCYTAYGMAWIDEKCLEQERL